MAFNFTYRYINDVLSINNCHSHSYVKSIYPSDLEKQKDTTDYQTSVSYLDVLLEKDVNGNLLTKLYDKRDIPSSPAYWVCVTQHALHTNNEQGDVLLKTSCWNKNIKTSIKIIIYML